MPVIQKPSKLPTDVLVRKGYFPLELPPPFITEQLADCMPALSGLRSIEPKSSKNSSFSIPKSWPARRILSIPNPLHQTLLCEEISGHWDDLQEVFETSAIALSTPTIFPGGVRAVSRRADFDEWSIERFQRRRTRDSFCALISLVFTIRYTRTVCLG